MRFRRICRGAAILQLGLAIAAGAAPVLTNMDLVAGTIEQAVEEALDELDTQAGADRDHPLLVAPQAKHAATWLVDHILAERLLARGFAVILDSTAARPGTPRLSYRILELGVIGHSSLWGGQLRRQSRVTLVLQLSGAQGDELDWQRKVTCQQADTVPQDRLPLLQDTAYDFAKVEVQAQTWGKFVEPVIVSSVLGGLIYLFFSNR